MPRFAVEVRNKNPHIAIPIKNHPKIPNHIAISVRSPRNISREINAAARNRRIATMKARKNRSASPNRGTRKSRSSSSSRHKL
jgi:hypothetical protein